MYRNLKGYMKKTSYFIICLFDSLYPIFLGRSKGILTNLSNNTYTTRVSKSKIEEEKMNENLEKQTQLKKQLSQLSTLRIAVFILALSSIVWGNYTHYVIGYILGSVLLIIFIILVRYYNKVNKILDYHKAREQVLNFYEVRKQDKWKEETTEEIYLEGAKLKDLDIIGQASLYQYINITHTKAGQKALLKSLSKGQRDQKVIMQRQTAIKELLEDEAFSLHLHTISVLFAKHRKHQEQSDIEQFIEEVAKKPYHISGIIRFIAIILPFLTFLSLTLTFLNYKPEQFIIIAEILFVVQLFISYIYIFKTGRVLHAITSFNEALKAYYEFIVALEKKNFKSSHLKQIQEQLFLKSNALSGLKSLSTLSGQMKIRYNWLASFLLNGLFMWDIHCLENLESWNKAYGDEITSWLESIGEVEALVSLSSIGRIKKTYCFPEILSSTVPTLSFKNMKHPLINEQKAVGNNFETQNATTIITGSNMSGKTTFLRSIGVNLILAYAGAPVVADTFHTSYMEVMTSMRIEDRVSEGISTFYAELLRIQEMVTYSERHLPMICLIDEIFKGTNSADRIFGATQIIKKLGKPWINVMVTTHDFELCELETQSERKTVNYHFEEYYKEDKIQFDYKIKEGRCQTTNATYLLKMVGLL